MHRRMRLVIGLLIALMLIFTLLPIAAPASAQLACAPDINRDGVVDLFDLIRVSGKYGMQNLGGVPADLPEDTNGDGKVNIADLVCVSVSLGAVTPPPPAPAPGPAFCEEARVIGIYDGDTIKVLRRGLEEDVRFMNVDAPELGQPHADEATALVRRLLINKFVCMEGDPAEPRDREGNSYNNPGRLLRYVWLGDVLAEAKLVEAGLAKVKPYGAGYRYESWLRALEAQARADRLGIWN